MYNGYTQTTDWVNKLTNITKSEQRIEKAKEMMQSLKQQVMAGKIPPGKGGSPGQPYQPPQPTGPYVPAPPRPPLAAAIIISTFSIATEGNV